VGEAQAVFDKKENIILDGRPLFIDYGKVSYKVQKLQGSFFAEYN